MADRYQVEAVLGRGGSGTVYRAWDRMLGELVAVKILHPQRALEKSWIRRLAREVKVARAIRHPNVCRVFELGQDRGRWFVTMELATRGSLRDLLMDESGRLDGGRGGAAGGPPGVLLGPAAGVTLAPSLPLAPAPSTGGGGSNPAGKVRPLPERIADVRALCAGLAAIHAVGITHRDVTPQNVLRMEDGRLVLTDFGLAIEQDDQTTVHGGTPAYMPPEAARGGRSDQRSDVFQLGMIISELLSGQRPHWAPDGTRLVIAEPRPGASAPEVALAGLVEKCVDPDPEGRPQSAVAVAGLLAAAEVARPPSWPVRVVARARRFWRQHTRLVKVAAAALVVAAVARTAQIVSRPPLCQGASDQLAGVWDTARAEAVRRSFVATGVKDAASAFARLRPMLDGYGNAWVAMYTDACQATHVRGEQSTEVLDLRMSCLKRAQVELRSLTDLFSSADRETVSRAFGAASDLSPVSTCGDVAVLKAVVRPPADRATATRVEELRGRVADLKALYGAGRYKEGASRSEPLLADVRAVGYDPLTAEALRESGMVEFWNHQEAEGLEHLDEAIVRAEGSRHDRVLAEAAVAKVMLLGYLGKDVELLKAIPWTEAVVKRLGGDRRLESWLYNAIGDDDRLMGRGTEALAMYRRALETKRAYLGVDHWDVALSVGNVANVLHDLGRNEEALRENERALVVLEKTRHPDLPLHVYNRGEIRLALGQPREALADFERAMEMWQRDLPHDHPYFGYALTGIGNARLALGERGAAVVGPLERAYALREGARDTSPGGAKVGSEEHAGTEFSLARALWTQADASPADRRRALELAGRARDEYAAIRSTAAGTVEGTLRDWTASGLRVAEAPGRDTRPAIPPGAQPRAQPLSPGRPRQAATP
jgi:tetratricopeptide (TPR) repeat protein